MAPTEDPAALKHAFFDFDQTISRCHVFKQLAGWEDEHQFVPPPFALTERGQIFRIHELNGVGCWAYDEESHMVVPCADGEPWTRAALGGAARVGRLSALFADLRAAGVTMTIVTKGYVGAVRKVLSEEGLLDFFATVYGNVGSTPYGVGEYDKKERQPSPFEGEEKCAAWTSKATLIKGIVARAGLRSREAVLIEDDPAEIVSVRAICRQVFVEGQRGMLSAEMSRIRALALPAALPPCARSVKRPSTQLFSDADAASDVAAEGHSPQGDVEGTTAPKRPKRP